MKRIFVAALMFALTMPALAQEPQQVKYKFDGRKWVIGHTQKNSSQVMVEYVLDGEDIENWSELVTIGTAAALIEREN